MTQNCLPAWASHLLREQVSVHKGECFIRWVETSLRVTWFTRSLAESCWLVLSGHSWEWCAGGKSKHTGLMLWLEVPVRCRTSVLVECLQGTSRTVAHDTAKIMRKKCHMRKIYS
jgi:hypothetical protein